MIQIFTENGIELPYKEETLTIRYKNPAFSKSFTVFHSEFPFLIIETPEVIAALGTSQINSTNRKKEFKVKVIDGNKVYFGILKIVGYLEGARKCDIKYGSKLLELLERKIADFMPTYYFDTPKPYEKEITTYYDQSTFMPAVELHATKQYPDVHFALPLLYQGLRTDGFWGDVSGYNERKHIPNTSVLSNDFKVSSRTPLSATTPNVFSVDNNNQFLPCVYLMSMITLPLLHYGFQLKGNFLLESIFSKVIVVPSGVDNMTTLRLKTVSADNLSDYVINQNPNQEEEIEMYLMHPTVELKRFVPDWTFAELINHLKNWLNLDITPDDTHHHLNMNYNVAFLKDTSFVDLSKSPINYTSKLTKTPLPYKIGYESDVSFIIIDDNGLFLETATKSESITNGFNLLPGIPPPFGPSVFARKEDLEKEGVAITLFDGGIPATPIINGEDLKMKRSAGIFPSKWKEWTLFRQNALNIGAKGYLNGHQISQIKKHRKIYFDNKLFAVKEFVQKIYNQLNEISFKLENLSAKPSLVNLPNLNPVIVISATADGDLSTYQFGWEIDIVYAYSDFNYFNGTIKAEQLVGGVTTQPTGLVYTKEVSQQSGTSKILLPIPTGASAGWYKITLEDSGVISNEVFVAVDIEVTTPAESIVLSHLSSSHTGGYYTNTETITIQYNGFAPVDSKLIVATYNGSIAIPTSIVSQTPINDITLSSFQVNFPGDGQYLVYVEVGVPYTAGYVVSNYLSFWVANF